LPINLNHASEQLDSSDQAFKTLLCIQQYFLYVKDSYLGLHQQEEPK
ncbi:1324_t:CDS:1, partial [Cetraspora pellucida]